MRTEIATEVKSRGNRPSHNHVYCHAVISHLPMFHCSVLGKSKVPISISRQAWIQPIYRPSYSNRVVSPPTVTSLFTFLSLMRMGSSGVQDTDTDMVPPIKTISFILQIENNISLSWFLLTPNTQFSILGDEKALRIINIFSGCLPLPGC